MAKYTINIADIEAALLSLGGDAKAKQIQDKVLAMFCNGVFPENYQDQKSFRQTIQRKIEDYCPQAKGYDSSKKEGKFLRVGHGQYRMAAGYFQTESLAIEEVPEAEDYVEGATKKIFVNYYERNPQARKKCIEHYGIKCVACGFDFELAYGEAGKGFIHVHHVVPLSEVRTSYVVNPIEDLRPVCANCHAVIHRTLPALTIAELQGALGSSGPSSE
jgi:5-methylcytosine-specific restriction protein A